MDELLEVLVDFFGLVLPSLAGDRAGLGDLFEVFDADGEGVADLEYIVHGGAADRAVQDREERRVRHGNLLGKSLERVSMGLDERFDVVFACHLRPSFSCLVPQGMRRMYQVSNVCKMIKFRVAEFRAAR